MADLYIVCLTLLGNGAQLLPHDLNIAYPDWKLAHFRLETNAH